MFKPGDRVVYVYGGVSRGRAVGYIYSVTPDLYSGGETPFRSSSRYSVFFEDLYACFSGIGHYESTVDFLLESDISLATPEEIQAYEALHQLPDDTPLFEEVCVGST